MNKKIFDIRLYRDALRQLRVIGSAAGIILMLEAVLLPLYQAIVEVPRTTNGYLDNRDLWELHPIAVLVFTVVVPAMTLYLFRFLNSRRDSDFYHSLPQTRVCVAVSFLSAVLTWAAALQWGTTLVSVLLHIFLPTGSQVLFHSLILESLSFTILSILVAGAILLSMSITGNTFSNIMVTGLILWGPRAIMLAVQTAVGMSLSIISQDHYLPFLGNGFNILTGSTFGKLLTGSSMDLFTSAVPMCYTLGLGLVYCGLGILFFHRRASESAGDASVNSGLQMVFRLLPAFLFSLIPNVIIFTDLAEGSEFTAEESFNLFIMYLVAVILYFLYELISTRKVANLRRAIPGVVILLGLNVLVIGGMMGMRHSLLSFHPAGEEIESVSLSAGSAYLTWNVNEGYPANMQYDGYFSSRLAQVRINDSAVKAMAADRLQAALDHEINHTEYGDMIRKDIIIRTGNRTVVRRIGLTNRDLQLMAETLKNDSEVWDIYMDLPRAEDPNLEVLIQDYRTVFSPEQTRVIYQALQEDARDMGFVCWFAYLSKGFSAADLAESEFSTVSSVGDLYLIYSEQDGEKASAIPISNVTPKALKAYRTLQMENQRGDEGVEKVFRTVERLTAAAPEQQEMSTIQIYGDLTDKAGMRTGDIYVAGASRQMQEACELVLELYRRQDEITVEDAESYLRLTVDVEMVLDRQGELAGTYEDIYNSENVGTDMTLAVPEGYDLRILTDSYSKG